MGAFNTPTIDTFRGDFFFLSNFYPAQFRDKDGVPWPSTEHFYQAGKASEAEDREWIRSSPTPGISKRRGRSVRIRKDWDAVKTQIMLEALRYKFTQNPSLKQQLINTSPAILVEGNTWGDTYWGVCRGAGENRLGKLLMQLREELIGIPNGKS